ncbi:hypothetical protein SDC9_149613 [bioreactor metagenome]|uniref:Uncharacterized protein n=1 Tax=bioreactor metagenome TaxID=1076179 RepID=A0A645EKU2_9ZZZZ
MLLCERYAMRLMETNAAIGKYANCINYQNNAFHAWKGDGRRGRETRKTMQHMYLCVSTQDASTGAMQVTYITKVT